jgi:hypothetical protein
MPNGVKKGKKHYYKTFNLAAFISEDRCISCGSEKTLEKTPEEVPDHYAPSPDYPVSTWAEEFFFTICPECRTRITSGLCIKCGEKAEDPDADLDYFILHVGRKMGEEIIRLRSEFTKWIPEIMRYKKATGQYDETTKPQKDVKKLFKKRKKNND